MALSLDRRKQGSKAFDLVVQEERVRSGLRGPREERAQAAVTDLQDRIGNQRLAGALELGADGLLGGAAGLGVDDAPLAGHAGFLHDQLSLALAGFDTTMLGVDASNTSVMDAMSFVGAPGYGGDYASGTAAAMDAAMMRRAEATDYDASSPAVQSLHARGGTPLPPAVAARLGAAFGHDFSHVRVHVDAQAQQAAEALNAKAFAMGTHIWFGRGAWNPGSPDGDRVLAHELTHVVQHDEGRLPTASGDGMSVSSPSDTHEAEAYANEHAMVAAMGGPSTAPMAPAELGLETDAGSPAMESGPAAGAAADVGESADLSAAEEGSVSRKKKGLGELAAGVRSAAELVTNPVLPGGGGPGKDGKGGGHSIPGVPNASELVQTATNAAQSAVNGVLPTNVQLQTPNGGDIKGMFSGAGLSGNVNVGGVQLNAQANANGLNVAANGQLGQNGPKINGNVGVGADGFVSGQGNVSIAGPNGQASLNLGPDGKLTGQAAGQLNVGGVGLSGSAQLGPDGKPVVNAAVMGPDGKPLAQGQVALGPDGKPMVTAVGPDGKPIAPPLGPDGKPLAGPDGKPVLGPDGKPVAGGAGGTGGTGGAGGGGGGGGGGGDSLTVGGEGNALGLGANGEPRALGNLSLRPFDLAEDAAKKLQKKTGRTPEQHQQAIREHVDRIRAQVETMREGLKVYAQEKSAAIDAEVKTAQDAINGDTATASARVSGAYSTAKGAVGAAATEALGLITAAGTEAKAQLATSLPAELGKLTTMITTARTAATNLGPTWNAKFKTGLDEGSKEFETVAGECATSLANQKAALIGTNWPDAGDALVRAENEAARLAAGKGIDEAVADFRSGGTQKAANARGQLPTYTAQITAAIAAVNAALDTHLSTGTTQLNAANTTATADITAKTTEATTAITSAKTSAEAALDGSAASAAGELTAAKERNLGSIATAGTQAKETIKQTDTQIRSRYADWFDNVLNGLPKDQATTYDSVKEFLDGRERELPTFHAGVMAELDQGCEAARQTVVSAATSARTAISGLADSSARRAQEQAKQQADGVRATGQRFGVSIKDVGGAVTKAFAQHIVPMQGLIDARLLGTTNDLTTSLASAKATLHTQAEAYRTELNNRILQMPTTLAPMVTAAKKSIYDKLRKAAQGVHSAAGGWGTDESGIYNSLRGLTALQGQALETVVWPRLFSSKTLRGVITDELDDDDQKIAFAYLSGNTALGARLEINSSMRWYGDDEAQIEKILRELSPADLAAMKAQPEWEAVHSRLRDNLGGTDLNVTEALVVGNVARADAYRLRDQINEARRSNDPDALHKALQGVDPATLAAVQQEFHNIQNGVKPDATNVPPVDQQLAAQELGDYVTRDIEMPGPEGQSYTNTIKGPNADLARNLAMQGRDSTAAAVSRFEVERTRSGGPNQENLETALMAPADLQAQLHDPDPAVRQRAQQAQDQREAAIRQQYQAVYGGPEGRSMDQAINGMYQGSDKQAETSRRLAQNMLQDGTNSPRVAADMIWLGREGLGTNEAQIKRALNGMRPDEVQALSSTYAAQHGNGDPTALFRDLGVNRRDENGNPIPGQNFSGFGSELSGDDRREVEELLLGDPKYMTLEQQMGLARTQNDWAVGSEAGFMSGLGIGGGDEKKDLQRNFQALTALQGKMRPDGTFANPADAQEFERLCGDVGVNATQYRAAVDRTANYITTGVAIVGAVVVTAATFGSGAPAGAAMIMAAAGTAATGAVSMGVNYGMKGGRYGWEQAVTDAGLTAVQTATAGLGAYGNALKVGQGTLGVVGGQMAVGAGTGFINGVASTALTDGTWDRGIGAGLGEVMIGGVKQSAMDAASAGISGGIEETGLGRRMQESGMFQSALLKGTANAAGGMGSTAVGLSVDAARGKFKGESWDVAAALATEGAKQFAMGAGGGALGTGLKPHFDARRAGSSGTGNPAPDAATTRDTPPPPPAGGAGGQSDSNRPPPPPNAGATPDSAPGGSTRTGTSTPEGGVTQTTQTGQQNNSAAGSDGSTGGRQTQPGIDPATGRPPAGSGEDASRTNRTGGQNDGDAQIVRTPEGNTVITRDRVVTATDDGVQTVDRDGTQTLIDNDGNRTIIDSTGTKKTITAQGDLVVQTPDGKTIAIAPDGTRVQLDQNGRPILPDNSPTKESDVAHAERVFNEVDKMIQEGKLSHEEGYKIISAGEPAAQEAMLRTRQAAIAKADAVLDKLIELNTKAGPDGKMLASEADVDRVLSARDPEAALRVVEANARNKQSDFEVKQSVDQKTVVGADGESYVAMIYDNVTVGAGFAGISNEVGALASGAKGNRLVVGGENPWLSAKADLGQRAGESEVVGGTKKMAETADTASAAYMAAKQHAENVEINRADAGVGVLREKIDGVETKSSMPEGTEWHMPDAKARIRVADGTNPDGSPKYKYIYTNQVDIANGAGPSRQLSSDQITPELMAKLRSEGKILNSDQAFDGGKINEGDKVVVYGAGAAGAWGVEGSYKNASEVEWLGRMPKPNDDMPATQKARLEKMYTDLDSAVKSGDVVAKEKAMQALERFAFTEAKGNGFLPRNKRQGAAFDGDLQQDSGGKIKRTLTDDAKSITWEVNPATGKEQIKIVGQDGHVAWADKLVLAIGQDGNLSGGPGHMLAKVTDGLVPIVDASNKDYDFPVVVGLSTPDGSVRVLGAAATSPSVIKKVQSGQRDLVQDNLLLQATDKSVPVDSNGVVGSFHHAEKMIRAANGDGLINLAKATPEQQAKIHAAHKARLDQSQQEAELRTQKAPELPQATKVGPTLVTPEMGVSVTTPKQGDTPLIGVRTDLFDPTASAKDLTAQLGEQGVPRQQKLSVAERQAESNFADWAQRNPEIAKQAALKLAEGIGGSADQPIFEVDAMKRLVAEYGTGSKPATPEERAFRLEMNHALHPTAVAIARLGFMERLDVLAKLPDGHPMKQVFVTSGGCAAGKGDLTGIVKDALGDKAKFGAVWDAAGEGDALESAWILKAAEARGIKTVFGYAEADPKTRYQSVLERANGSGRVVDVLTFINSYTDGAVEMKRFMDSPEYKAAEQAGNASAFGIAPGEFNRGSLKDNTQKAYPDVKPLNDSGKFEAQHVGAPPNKQEALDASLRILEDYVARERAAGKDPTAVAKGALENAIKFLDQQPIEIRRSVLASYKRIFGALPKDTE